MMHNRGALCTQHAGPCPSLGSAARSTSQRPSSHRCKVAVSHREGWDPSSLHDQAHLAADSLVAKSHECAQQYQHNPPSSPPGQQLHSNNVALWRSSSARRTASAQHNKWPWSLWGRETSSTGSGGSSGQYSRAHGSSGWPASLLEQSAAAVSQQHASRRLMQQPLEAGEAVASSTAVTTAPYQQSAQHASGSGSDSSWEESAAAALRTMDETWDFETSNSRGASSAGADDGTTQLFLYDLMPPAAAEAVAAEVTPSSTSSKMALLLGDTYPAAVASTGGGQGLLSPTTPGSSGTVGSSRQQHQQQRPDVWGLQLDAAESSAVPLPSAAALRRSLKAVGPLGQPRPATGSSGSSPSSSRDDADWLTAVLSDPTSRLTSHSNAVLTNSLKRLASLRNTATGSSNGLAASSAFGAEGLIESMRERFHTFQLAQFEDVALQLAQMGYRPDPHWLASFERASMSVMAGGSPRLLSRLLLSRSKIAGRVSSEWCAACCLHMAAMPQKLSVSSWCNALYALVRLKYTPNRQFQAAFFNASSERLDDISPELLTHLVWSLARLKLSPSSRWWRSLVSATASVEKPFSHTQLASLLHSVALWAGDAPPGGGSSAAAGGSAAQDVQGLVDLLLREIHQHHLPLLQPAELTTVLWSLGSLVASRELQPDPDLTAQLLGAVQDQLPRLNPAQCSNLCWGLAKLQHNPLPDGFHEALLLEVQAQLSGFSNSSLCSVLWALARLEHLVPLVPFREQLWEELHHRIKSLTMQDLSTLLWALAQMQLQPPDDLLHELCESTAVHITACSDSTHLTNIVWSLGRLHARPDRDWLEAAEAASLKVLPTAGLTQVVNLVWGLTRLRVSAASAGVSHSDHGTLGSSDAPHSFSTAWQVACLRELRLRCSCQGHAVDARELLQVLRELGVSGLAEEAAVRANQLFQDQDDESACMLQFQPGCR